jgi:UDP-N-acetyl-D-glucosamine dehydrogenase
VVYNDPHISHVRMEGKHYHDMDSTDYSDELIDSADCVVIVTDQSSYNWQHLLDHSKVIVDTRHMIPSLTGKVRVILL